MNLRHQESFLHVILACRPSCANMQTRTSPAKPKLLFSFEAQSYFLLIWKKKLKTGMGFMPRGHKKGIHITCWPAKPTTVPIIFSPDLEKERHHLQSLPSQE
jgi:hypothetical protein